jgi:uncharacterized protein
MAVAAEQYIPSRFISLTFDHDQSLIVNSSRTGAMGVVPPDKAESARRMLIPGTVTTGPLTGISADLAEGGLLVPAQLDEAQLVHSSYLRRYDQSRLELFILPTEECNFRCVYCYESFLRGEMAAEVRDGIRRFVAGQEGLESFALHWFGGEPFLAPTTVLELMTWLRRHCDQHKIKFIASATTNGSLLTPEFADQIIPLGCDSFQITLDGVEEEHNVRRHGVNGEQTFRPIMDNLRYLRDSSHEFTVMLRHNFDPKSLSRLDEYLAMIKEEFAGDRRFRTHFEAIGRWGGPNDDELVVCEDREGPRAILQAQKKAAAAGFRDGLALSLMGPDGYVCYAANPRSFIIGADATVYKCTIELDYHERNKVGRLRQDGVMELDWRRMALWCETDGMETGKKCNTCWFSPSCHGAICPKEWMDVNDVTCPPSKQTIQETLKFARAESAVAAPDPDANRSYCAKG